MRSVFRTSSFFLAFLFSFTVIASTIFEDLSDFTGTFINTTTNSSGIILAGNNTTGTYTSLSIGFNATLDDTVINIRNISWGKGGPYLDNLPNNGETDTLANMSKNILLLHMDEDFWFNGTDLAYDSSGYGNNMTPSSSANTTTAQYKFGTHSGNFTKDGTDYLTRSNLIGANHSFTIIVWAYRTRVHAIDTLVGELNDFFFGADSLNRTYIRIITSDGTTKNYNGAINSFPFGQWVQAGMTVNFTEGTAYYILNGVKTSAITNLDIDGIRDIATVFRIGTYSGASSNDWEGYIDEVAVWNRTLTDEEIKRLYMRGVALQFQARVSPDNLTWGNFVGSDGTNATYFTNNSFSRLRFNETRFIQYKAFLEGIALDTFNDSYQETADEITCSGSFQPGYPCSNAYDGDWNTYAWVFVGTSSYNSLLVNYTKPSTFNSAKWQVKDHSGGLRNLTINQTCLDYSASKLVLRVDFNQPGIADGIANYSCYDGSWVSIQKTANDNAGQIYEEAIWWNTNLTDYISPLLTNVTLGYDTEYLGDISYGFDECVIDDCPRDISGQTLNTEYWNWTSGTWTITGDEKLYMDDGSIFYNYATSNTNIDNFTGSFVVPDGGAGTQYHSSMLVNYNRSSDSGYEIRWRCVNPSRRLQAYRIDNGTSTQILDVDRGDGSDCDGTVSVAVLSNGTLRITAKAQTAVVTDTTYKSGDVGLNFSVFAGTPTVDSINFNNVIDRRPTRQLNYSFNSFVIEGSTQEYFLYINSTTVQVDDINASLNWNGTIYTPTKSVSGPFYTFNASVEVPMVDNISIATVNWTFNISQLGTMIYRNTSTTNQTINITPINYTFDPLVYELENTTFTLQINVSDENGSVNAVLVWNGTEYSPTLSNTSTQFNFTRVIEIPTISSNNTSVTWNWKYNMTTFGVTKERNTTEEQTIIFAVYPVDIQWNPTNIIEGREVRFNATIFDYHGLGDSINVTYTLWGYSGEATYLSHSGTKSYYGFNLTPPLITSSEYNDTVNVTASFNPSRTRSENITYYGAVLTNCSAGSLSQTETLIFYIKNELNRSLMNGDLDISITLTDPEITPTAFSFKNNTTHRICIFPTWASFENTTIELQYEASGYGDRFYSAELDLNNVSKSIDLYLLDENEGQSITFQVRNLSSNSLIPRLTIYIKRRYFDLNNTIYLTVATVITGADGKGKAFVDTTGAFYQYVVLKDNTTIFTFAPTQITSNPTELVIGYSLFGDWNTVFGDVSGRCIFTGATNNTLQCTAVSSSGAPLRTCLKVDDVGMVTKTNICNTCTYDLGTTVQECNVSSASHRVVYTFYYDYQGVVVNLVTGSRSVQTSTPSLGADGAMVGFVVVITLGIIGGCMHPIIGMILAVFGLAGLDLMNIYVINQEALITLVLIIAIIAFLRLRAGGS